MILTALRLAVKKSFVESRTKKIFVFIITFNKTRKNKKYKYHSHDFNKENRSRMLIAPISEIICHQKGLELQI